MSKDHIVWFSSKDDSYGCILDLACNDGLTYAELDDKHVLEQYVEDKFNATLVRDSAEDEEFWQWIGIQFKNEQDMIMFILRGAHA